MAIPQRRAVAQAAAPAGVNFGSLDFYVAGGGLPDGDYIAVDHSAVMYQAKSQQGVSKGPPRLGVMITFQPMHDLTPEAQRTQFYSMGTNADKSFAPNPETGKGIVAVPGGPSTTVGNSTNWAMYLKSMYDCGLPEGIFMNDLSVLDGVHVHVQNVPEPEERKGFANKNVTGEAQPEERKNGTVAIVSEIKDDGKPWEGTGGIPAAATAKVNGKPGLAKPVVRAAAPKPAPVAEATGDEDVQTAALNGISSVLEKKPEGTSKLLLRTGTFSAVKAVSGDDMANAVLESFFADDATLGSLLGQVGYTLNGAMVKPA